MSSMDKLTADSTAEDGNAHSGTTARRGPGTDRRHSAQKTRISCEWCENAHYRRLHPHIERHP